MLNYIILNIINSISDGTIGWLVRGAALEVFSNSDGQRLAAWCYGVALKDQQTVITTVTEYTYDNGIKLLVATITPNTESALLSVFDVKTSRVLKSVEIPYQVRYFYHIIYYNCTSCPFYENQQ